MKIVLIKQQGLRECDPEGFDIQRHMLDLAMNTSVFYATVSRHIRKRPTLDIPTAGVAYDEKRREVTLWFNPRFYKSLSDRRILGVNKHEIKHVVLRHITCRRRKPHGRWNLATDMAIDNLIYDDAVRALPTGRSMTTDEYPLPLFMVRPGHLSWVFDPRTYSERPITVEEKAAMAVVDVMHCPSCGVGVKDHEPAAQSADCHACGGPLRPVRPGPDVFKAVPPTDNERRAYTVYRAIESAPAGKTSEWYFDYLEPYLAAECEHGPGSLDDHDGWDDVPDDMLDKVDADIRAIIARAVREADSQGNGWGNMPADLIGQIRRSVEPTLDWRSLIDHFVGRCNRMRTRRSVRALDRKQPMVHPGTLTAHGPHLVLVIDQSGSVSDALLDKFFANIEALGRQLTITILPFDAACKVEDAWVWRKGDRPTLERTKCGGTDFDAPTQVINDNARERGWEGAIFVTDGGCSKPLPCYIPRMWLLGPGDKLTWDEAEEPVVVIDDGAAVASAPGWM